MMELYVHFPFCVQKCRYCDFASRSGLEGRMDEYVDALLADAAMNRVEITEPIETVYFGGGTPSLLPPDKMKRLLTGLRKILPLDQVREWTCEANPGTVSVSWLDTALEGGVNRLSLGFQAAQNRLLRMLGRIHRAEDVEESVRLARRAGFRNLSLDLMFGLPGQSEADWAESLRTAFALAPEHLSAYGLIPEEGTPLQADLEAGRLSLPDVETEREMYETLLRETQRQGYEQYEISNFAKPGFACRHNIGYWEQIPYLGLGVSAASMLRLQRGADGTRYLRRTAARDFESYLRGVQSGTPVWDESEWIEPKEARFESLMLGLRMNRGVSEKRFLDMHGISLEVCFGDKIRVLTERGLLFRSDGHVRLTRLGMDLQNTALVELMD